MDVFEAIAARRSVRGFRSQPVERAVLERLFGAAQRAPSWCNIQPWRVALTAPALTEQLRARLLEAARTSMPSPEVPFPVEYPEPYKTHRRACGAALYRAMGVAYDDKSGRYQAWLRNFGAFGAPHVAIVSMDRRFGVYAALDIGCWLQTVLLAATALGLATCPQASLATYPEPVRSLLAIPDGDAILCGIAIGYLDDAEPANACTTDRSPLADNVRFLGF
ncbi:MAG TPA: nitroreductase [Polyangia bacterium]|nr:nitroreductase [Polyangia bacterium]